MKVGCVHSLLLPLYLSAAAKVPTVEVIANIETDGSRFAEAGGLLFFAAREGTADPQLWVTDLTAGGTNLVKEICPPGTRPVEFVELNGKVVIIVGNPFYDSIGNYELWSSDGTAAGTEQIKPRCENDICSADLPSPGNGQNRVGRKAAINGRLVFAAEPTEIWSTDGTRDGTVPLRGFRTTAHDADGFLESDGELFILAGGGLWVTDGTVSGTRRVAEFSGGGLRMAPFGGRMGLGGSGPGSGGKDELWISDGTESGTTLVADINPVPSGSSVPANFRALGGRLLFSADDGSAGRELWVTDGTALGTRLVRDINAGPGDSDPGGNPVVSYFGPRTYPASGFSELDGRLIFQADDGVNGNELWATDGTEAGTYLVKDINPGGGALTPLPSPGSATGSCSQPTTAPYTGGSSGRRMEPLPGRSF